MEKHWITKIVSLLLVIIVPVCWYIQNMDSLHDSPRASAGTIDLSDWDFAANGTVLLRGEWEFYPNQWIAPGEPGTSRPQQKGGRHESSGFISVPGKWDKNISEDGKRGPFGFGTYRLLIHLNNDQEKVYGIRTTNIRMANRLFLNGQEVGSSGNPGSSPNQERADNVPYTVFAALSGSTVEVVVQVSNFTYSSGGGMVFPIEFGDQQSVMRSREFALFYDVLTSAGFLLPAIYFYLLYRMRRQDQALFHLAFFCLFALIYVLTHGEKLGAAIWPGLPYEIVLRLQLISSTFAYFFLLRYVAATVPLPAHRRVLPLFTIAASFLVLSGSVLPTEIFTQWEVQALGFGFASVTYVLYVILIVSWRQTGGSGFWVLVSLQSILVIILVNILYLLGVDSGPMVMMYELLLFVLAQALIQAKRSAQSFKEVEQLSQKLLTLDGLKDEFMANTSHELRTPLHGIVNMAQSMIEGAAGKLNPEQKKQLSVIVSTGKRLSSLINDIIDFAKLKNGDIVLKRDAVDFHSVAHSVLEITQHLIGKKDIRFVKEWPADLPRIDTDEERLQQILYNLLGNAVKFTRQGEIRIKAEAFGGQVKVSVADTGIGIAKERFEDIFKSFDQGGSAVHREYSGTGLGLSITKKLVELNGGRLWVDSELGRGSTFYFTLPAAKDRMLERRQIHVPVKEEAPLELAPVGAPPLMESRGTGAGCVLIVDDDPVNLQVLNSLLSVENYEIMAIDNGADALEALIRGHNVDVVIADWMMPGMTGIELCKGIRDRFSLSDLPILMLTARSRPQDLELGFQAGVNDFLSKPVDAIELRARVRTLLELRRSVQTSIRTEMAFLQAQIKPHFLYNALNTIIATCPINPDQAVHLLLELSQYLRSSFDFQNRDQLTPLQNELELVKSYLFLEKARFDDRLQIEFEVDESLQALIPPLSIQPIVENAVKHGVMQRAKGGLIEIKVQGTEDGFTVLVQDDGIGIPQHKLDSILSDGNKSGSVGLMNIHKRLLTLYGKGLVIESEWEHGTTVSFSVPRKVSWSEK
ncbi:ATP-binding protein [Paenibacillus sp. PvR098]|uniref:hybrid sensor histidine kinase/response regulator n=1 Tax=unclassified Paenibacillus TaxID=185978 RepID=UPI001B5BDE89|nr:signal transduction histidine kinase [Paenibacillus sp. PvP091]MBP1171931.1 signal transduction histidine kinase [Paenibacillus sp. PvR098]MBP2438312.1 signal transduction histidine kinase [Paenibacillus sp. PvP052]